MPEGSSRKFEKKRPGTQSLDPLLSASCLPAIETGIHHRGRGQARRRYIAQGIAGRINRSNLRKKSRTGWPLAEALGKFMDGPPAMLHSHPRSPWARGAFLWRDKLRDTWMSGPSKLTPPTSEEAGHWDGKGRRLGIRREPRLTPGLQLTRVWQALDFWKPRRAH